MKPLIGTLERASDAPQSSPKINVTFAPSVAFAPDVVHSAQTAAAPASAARTATLAAISELRTRHPDAAVVIAGTSPRPGRIRDAVVADIAATLAQLLATTGGDYWLSNRDADLRSRDMWYLLDHLHSPRLGLWIDVETLIARGETPSVFLKQLAQFARAVVLRFAKVAPIVDGADDANVSRTIEILKGLGYRGLIVIDDVPPDDAGRALAARLVQRLQDLWDRPVVVLAAYKGDKNAPKFVAR
ncbi:MAG: hypothetical protein ACKVS9_12830 [Phycisphaerae bacterium]